MARRPRRKPAATRPAPPTPRPAARNTWGPASAGPEPSGVVWLVVVLVATVVVYSPIVHALFIPFDDPIYFFENRNILDGLSLSGLRWAMTASVAVHWHPLTVMSHMADATMFGATPRGPHLINLAFHLVNTVLLFAVLRALTDRGRLSAIVAGFFALHPLHVESVAWISARKDVLSALFVFLTLAAYIRYARRGGIWRMALVALAFAAALMSKAIVVVLPLGLLLLDYWPLARMHAGGWTRLVLEKVPLLLLSLGSTIITIVFQRAEGIVMSTEVLPVPVRATNALISYAVYLWKTLWPMNLAYYYPHPFSLRLPAALLALLLLTALSALAWRTRRARPFLIVGWLWYLSMLAPVIGLIQSAAQAMADRYTYLPLIGIFVAIVWSADGLTGMPRRIAGLAAAASLAACTALTFFQVRTWQDPSTLATQALRVTSGNAPAHIMLGAELMKRGQVDDAIGQLEASLRVTDSTEANANLGIAFMARKEPAKALVHFERAAARDPDSAKARYNLGHALTTLTRYEEAYPHLARAVALDPNHATAHLDMAVVLTARGDIAAAVPHLREVLRLDPGNIDVLRNLALIEATHPDPALRNGADAVRLAERARDLTNGQNTVILFTLGAAYAEAGRFDEAQAAVGAGLERAAAEQSAALLVQGRDLLNLFKSRQPFHQPPSGLPGR